MDPNQLRQILKEELKPIIDTQKEQGKVLAEHSKILGEHSKILGEHSKILDDHSKILGEQGKILGEHGEKLDSITVELHQVHQLASVTADIVVVRYEKNKREIDEIKDHLNLPKEPYFGESN